MFGMPDQMLIQIVKIFDRGIEPPCAIEEVVSGFMHQFRDIHTAFEEGDLFGGGNYSRVLKRSKEPALFQLVRGTEVRSRDQLNSRSSESLSDQAREIGRAHVLTPVTNAHLVCRLLLEKKKQKTQT